MCDWVNTHACVPACLSEMFICYWHGRVGVVKQIEYETVERLKTYRNHCSYFIHVLIPNSYWICDLVYKCGIGWKWIYLFRLFNKSYDYSVETIMWVSRNWWIFLGSTGRVDLEFWNCLHEIGGLCKQFYCSQWATRKINLKFGGLYAAGMDCKRVSKPATVWSCWLQPK